MNSLRPTVRTGAAIPTIHCPHQQQHHDHHHNHRQHQHREAPQRQQQERPVDVRSRVRRDPIKAGRNDGRPCRTDGGAIAHTTGNLRGTGSRNASFEQTLQKWQSRHPRVATPARRNPSIPAPHVNARHGGMPSGDARARYQCAVTPTRTERDARPSQSQHSGRTRRDARSK